MPSKPSRARSSAPPALSAAAPSRRPTPNVADKTTPAVVSAPAPAPRPGDLRPSAKRKTAPSQAFAPQISAAQPPAPVRSRSVPTREVESIDRPGLPDVSVLRTSWHPSADRRSTRVRLEESNEIVNLKEGDAVGGLIVQEITPSSVLFSTGDVEIRRRVGAGG